MIDDVLNIIKIDSDEYLCILCIRCIKLTHHDWLVLLFFNTPVRITTKFIVQPVENNAKLNISYQHKGNIFYTKSTYAESYSLL